MTHAAMALYVECICVTVHITHFLLTRNRDGQVAVAALLKNNCDTDITVLCLIPHADDILHIACHWMAMP
jgi:hypothetical protein